jgi:hypothetical protein
VKLLCIFVAILNNVFMNFLLEIDAHGAVNADNFVGADTCFWGNVAARVRDFHVCGIVTDDMNRPLNSRGNNSRQNFVAGFLCRCTALRRRLKAE